MEYRTGPCGSGSGTRVLVRWAPGLRPARGSLSGCRRLRRTIARKTTYCTANAASLAPRGRRRQTTPGRDVEIRRDEEIGDRQPDHERGPAVAGGDNDARRQALADDRRQVAAHPAALQQHDCSDGEVDNARLQHHPARAVREDRRGTEYDDEADAQPLHRLDALPAELFADDLPIPAAAAMPTAAVKIIGRGVDREKQDRREEILAS